MYFRARYYDPSTGEFLSKDPLGYVGGMSLYQGYFVIKGVDPSGMDWTVGFDNDGNSVFWSGKYCYIRTNKGFKKVRCPFFSPPKVPPGKIYSDDFERGSKCSCGGKEIDTHRQCCVRKTQPEKKDDQETKANEDFVYDYNERTKCKVCFREAQVPGGHIGPLFGAWHMWIKCEFGEVGLGPLGDGGEPGGVPGEDGIPKPYPITGINDHTGQSEADGSICREVQPLACCIGRHMVPRPTDQRCGLQYNCNDYVFEAMQACGVGKNQIDVPIIWPETALPLGD
jgi:hypothetical protein